MISHFEKKRGKTVLQWEHIFLSVFPSRLIKVYPPCNIAPPYTKHLNSDFLHAHPSRLAYSSILKHTQALITKPRTTQFIIIKKHMHNILTSKLTDKEIHSLQLTGR